MMNRNGKRIGAAALSLLMLASAVPTAAAVPPVVDEAYYGTLDYYGKLTDGSVVKSYRLNGNTDLADIGDYTEINNLTDRTEPEVNGQRVTFHLDDPDLKNFYFEGKTEKPFREMPFHIAISYRMNGVDCDPEDMAGQTGLAEITLDVTPNPTASAYQRENFALEAVTMCKDSKTLSVEAPGGQVQKVGDMDVVLFLVLPGEEQHFTLKIGSEDFSFSGFTFLCQPATLAQLDQVADLREMKEELEDSANDISDSLDEILDSLDGMGGDLEKTADGLDQLNRARGTVSAGKRNVYDQADRALAALTDLTQALKPAVDHIRTGKEALTNSTQALVDLTDTVDGLHPDLQTIRDDLVNVQGDVNALNDTLNTLKQDGGAIQDELGALSGDLGTINGDLSTFQSDVSTAKDDLRDLEDNLADLRTDLETLRTDLARVSKQTGNLRKEVDDLDGVDTYLPHVTSFSIGDKTYTASDIRNARILMEESVYPACVGVGYDDSALDLIAEKEILLVKFIMNNAEAITGFLVDHDASAVAQLEAAANAIADEKAPALADAETAQRAAEYGAEKGSAVYEGIYQQVYPVVRQQVYDQAYAAAREQAIAQAGKTDENTPGYVDQFKSEEQAQMLSLLHYQWDQGINVKQQLRNLDTFNDYVRSGNEKIEDFNETLRDVIDPTTDLMRALELLLDDVDTNTIDHAQELLDTTGTLLTNSRTALSNTQSLLDDSQTALGDGQALLDSARELIGHLTGYDNQALNDHANALFDTGTQTIGQLDDVLTQATRLSETITRYEPDVQAALSDAIGQVNAAVNLLGDLNSFGKTLEGLLQSAGGDLDAGSQTVLSGMSGTMRQASASLDSTGAIRRAKDTIHRLVEDKWDEYTGDVNNLLNADANAEKVSLTSPENQSPNSIQLIFRSQEIKIDEDAKDQTQETEQQQLGFWGRVGRMFHDFAAIFTGNYYSGN